MSVLHEGKKSTTLSSASCIWKTKLNFFTSVSRDSRGFEIVADDKQTTSRCGGIYIYTIYVVSTAIRLNYLLQEMNSAEQCLELSAAEYQQLFK